MASHPRRSYKACLDCGAAGTPGNGLSYRGLCIDCACARHAAANRAMVAKEGPIFEEWQRGMISFARDFLRETATST